MLPTQEKLNQILSYDPIMGILTWKIQPAGRIKIGSAAGFLHNRDGYRRVKIDGVAYVASHLAWVMYYGDKGVPTRIGHHNHDRADISIKNLFVSSAVKGAKNQVRSTANTSGITGVSYCRRGKLWCASIRINQIDINLGRYKRKSDAAAARKIADRNHLFHQNHGKTIQDSKF